MDIATKDDQNLAPNPASVTPLGAERGSVGVPEARVGEYVTRPLEQRLVNIPPELAQAGVTQGQDGLRFSPAAINAGVIPANPSVVHAEDPATLITQIRTQEAKVTSDTSSGGNWERVLDIFNLGKKLVRMRMPKAA